MPAGASPPPGRFDARVVEWHNERIQSLRHPLLTLAVLCLAALGAPACASDEEQVATTVKDFYRAASKGDGEEACGQLTAAARNAAGPGQCEAAIDQIGRLGGGQATRQLAAVKIRGTKVTGERATTQAELSGQTPVSLRLRKVDGDWKLESLGTQSSGAL